MNTRKYLNWIFWALVISVAMFFSMAYPRMDGPRLSISKSPSHTIIVDHIPEAAIGLCVVFQSEDELLDGLPWTPRHCTYWNAPLASIQDDWAFITPGHNYEMWAVIQTMNTDGTDGPDLETNHLHEAH